MPARKAQVAVGSTDANPRRTGVDSVSVDQSVNGRPTINTSRTPAIIRRPRCAGIIAVVENGRSASASAAYDAGRPRGSLARLWITMSARGAGIRESIARGDRGGSVVTRVTSSRRSRASNGGWPVSR